MFIFYIYDKTDGFIYKSFTDEDECIKAFNEMQYNSETFLPIDWRGLNIEYFPTFEERQEYLIKYCLTT